MELYLDATPLIQALRENPSGFEKRHGHILHHDSDHWLSFDRDGSARLTTRCNCAELPISKEQSAELRLAASAWEEEYWRPHSALEAAKARVAEINRVFAEHFRPRSRMQRAVDAIRRLIGLAPRGTPYRIDPSLPEDAELGSRSEITAQQIEVQELTLF